MILMLLVAALVASAGEGAGAQAERPPTPAPSASPAAANEEPGTEGAEPDISLTATVRYRELRFDAVGTPNVVFSGEADNKTVWHADRFNLPTPVQPGVTYRDGGVRLTITSTFADLIRMSSEPEGGAEAAPAPVPSPAVPAAEPPPEPQPPRAP
jgi:hypothetical protein